MRKLFVFFLIFLAPLALAAEVNPHVTTETTTLYFWSNLQKIPKAHLNLKKMKVADPIIFKYLHSAKIPQWLVASYSPVTLRQQGGSDDHWILLELVVRPGFKVLDLTSEVLTETGCPALSADATPPADCINALEQSVRSLSLDGFTLPSGEIVLANGAFFNAPEVQSFSRFSSDALPERLRIQTLFYKADHVKVGFADSLFPSEINRLNPPFSGGGRGLLWDDLDGKPIK